MEAEGVILLGVQRCKVLVCKREWGEGGNWRLCCCDIVCFFLVFVSHSFKSFFVVVFSVFVLFCLVFFLYFHKNHFKTIGNVASFIFWTFLGKSFRFISWKLKDINHPIKRNKVIAHLAQLDGDIFFLQETHLRSSEVNWIKQLWIGEAFHSKFPMRARGVAILIHKNVQFEKSVSSEDLNQGSPNFFL